MIKCREVRGHHLKRIGILTWHYYGNFGSALQTYALQTVLELQGYKVFIVNYRNIKFGKHSMLKKYVAYMLHMLLSRAPGKIGCNCSFPFFYFQKKFLHETIPFQNVDNIQNILKRYGVDTIVYGSDQIWAPNVFNPIYMGKGINSHNIKKISYAASLGVTDISADVAQLYKELLSEYEMITVREEAGVRLLTEKCGITAEVVLDPTLLLNASDYKILERKPRDMKEKEFCFCYFLNEDNQYLQTVNKFNIEKYALIGFDANKKHKNIVKNIEKIGPQEFLWLVHYAKHIYTDSYHGTIFSMLYHKQFNTFERFSPECPINQNSRINQLKKYFFIQDVIVPFDGKKDTFKEYDYSNFDDLLSELRKKSISFLERI